MLVTLKNFCATGNFNVTVKVPVLDPPCKRIPPGKTAKFVWQSSSQSYSIKKCR
jgi:hypothetical protein